MSENTLFNTNMIKYWEVTKHQTGGDIHPNFEADIYWINIYYNLLNNTEEIHIIIIKHHVPIDSTVHRARIPVFKIAMSILYLVSWPLVTDYPAIYNFLHFQ